MATLSAKEILDFALRAGFSPNGEEAVTATAIALAESGGDPHAHNDNASTGDDSYGLWQINMIGDIGPERRKVLGLTRNEELFDPATNARAARHVFKQQTFTAWSVFKNQRYKQHLGAARQAATQLKVSGFAFGIEPEPDLTVEELLDALESPRGMAILRRVITSRPGDVDSGSLFSKVADVQRDVDTIKARLEGTS